jgi:hypothetical protein
VVTNRPPWTAAFAGLVDVIEVRHRIGAHEHLPPDCDGRRPVSGPLRGCHSRLAFAPSDEWAYCQMWRVQNPARRDLGLSPRPTSR